MACAKLTLPAAPLAGGSRHWLLSNRYVKCSKRGNKRKTPFRLTRSCWLMLPLASRPRHERDSRQSPSRSGEVSKVSRQRFAGFRLKVPFSFARSSGKAISWTRRYDTLTACKIWLFWAGTRTGKYRVRNGNVPFEYVREKNSVRLPSKAKNFLKRKFQFSG